MRISLPFLLGELFIMKYVGFYDHEVGNRSMSLAATTKMNYIAEVIARNDEAVTIVSCGVAGKKKEPKHDVQLCKDVKFIILIPCVAQPQ